MRPQARFKNLDSIRSIAFLSTFLAHCFSTSSAEVLASPAYRGAVAFRSAYGFGVPVFFVLSGFLITYLMLREQEGLGRFSVLRFYTRRALRIWPLYYLVLLFGFVAFPLLRSLVEPQPYHESASPLLYAFFLSNFDQIRAGVLPYGVGLGPTWSISVEEQFYLLWPLMLMLFPRRRFAIPTIGVLGLAMVLSPLLALPREHTLFSMIYLAMGAAFAYASFYDEDRVVRLARTADAVPLAAAVVMVAAMQATGRIPGYFLFPIIGLLIGYLIVQQCFTRGFDLSRVPLLERTGKYTYGLYMYHSLCIFAVHALFQDVLAVEDTPLLVVGVKPVLSLLLSGVVSYLSYRWLERFFLDLKRSKFTPWHAESPPATLAPCPRR